MNLIASLVVRNEASRYLEPCITHLLEFCDQIVVLEDASDDGSREWLIDHADDRLHVITQSESTFFVHEGRTRQLLLDETLARRPTHVLSIDADEFVSDGQRLRNWIALEDHRTAGSLSMEEVWAASERALWVREDGGWRTHPLPFVWRAPARLDGSWRIMDRKLSTRRVPRAVLREGNRAKATGVDLLHFGWTDPDTRRQRYDRYARHDGGRFHASQHLRSILWSNAKVELREREWPDGAVFDGLRARFAAKVPA